MSFRPIVCQFICRAKQAGQVGKCVNETVPTVRGPRVYSLSPAQEKEAGTSRRRRAVASDTQIRP